MTWLREKNSLNIGPETHQEWERTKLGTVFLPAGKSFEKEQMPSGRRRKPGPTSVQAAGNPGPLVEARGGWGAHGERWSPGKSSEQAKCVLCKEKGGQRCGSRPGIKVGGGGEGVPLGQKEVAGSPRDLLPARCPLGWHLSKPCLDPGIKG